MIKLNDFVDKIYCINLERRQDRWEEISKEFERLELDVEKFNAIDGSALDRKDLTIVHEELKGDQIRGAQGAIKSHRAILKDAIDNNYDKIAVFEDDLIFCQDFVGRFNYYAAFVPPDWDIMYLGCHYHGCDDPIFIRKYIYKNKKNFGAFAFILKKSMIQFLYDHTKDEIEPIDDYMGNLGNSHNLYSFIPFFVKTTNTISDVSTESKPFEYETVNKYYSDYAHTYNPFAIKSKVDKPQQQKQQQRIMKDSEILKSHINSNHDFYIYKGGEQIFDSKYNKQNLKIYDQYFEIYGRRFDYRGIQIKNK